MNSFEQEVCDCMPSLQRFGFKFWSRTLSGDEIEDLVQETLVIGLSERLKFRGECKLSTWLCQIFKFRAIEYMRKRARMVSFEDVQEETPEQDKNRILEPSTDHTPENELAAAQQAMQIRQSVARLSPIHREAIELMYYGDLTIDEVATRVGVPVGTAKTRLFYAKKALAERLAV